MKFVSHVLLPGEIPELEHVIQEIDMTLMTPLRAAYYLMSSDEIDDSMVEQMLFVILGQWVDFEKELFEYINDIEATRKKVKESTAATKDSIFENARFWEYVAQIKIDGHDPANVLESWLKKHNPDHFKDPAELPEAADKGVQHADQ